MSSIEGASGCGARRSRGESIGFQVNCVAEPPALRTSGQDFEATFVTPATRIQGLRDGRSRSPTSEGCFLRSWLQINQRHHWDLRSVSPQLSGQGRIRGLCLDEGNAASAGLFARPRIQHRAFRIGTGRDDGSHTRRRRVFREQHARNDTYGGGAPISNRLSKCTRVRERPRGTELEKCS